MINSETREELEQIVDQVGLKQVVRLLAEVASAKADHLLTNWQDENAADMWERVALRLDALSTIIF